MSKVIFTRGLQGSGKSTWAKQWCIDHPDWVRVCRDDIRNMRGQYWLPKDEGMITNMEITLIIEALASNKNVVVDAMNLNHERDVEEKIRKIKRVISRDFPADWGKLYHEIKNFTNIPLEECIKRDLARPNSVGERVIRKTYEKYLTPPKSVYEEDPSLPHCIIVDVDGTLAKMNGRSPYDWDRVKEDIPNEPICKLVEMWQTGISFRGVEFADNHRIIVFTGRDGSCLEDTVEWLESVSIPWDEIYIRPIGDNRKDAIVKREMFDTYIRGKYYVDFVLDDRNQVVDMWRNELGLTCLQVDYGDF